MEYHWTCRRHLSEEQEEELVEVPEEELGEEQEKELGEEQEKELGEEQEEELADQLAGRWEMSHCLYTTVRCNCWCIAFRWLGSND
jgi:hypothetical protein